MYKNKTIFIFGAGANGRKFLAAAAAMDASGVYFLDNDPAKWGSTLDGIRICSTQELQRYPRDAVMIFIASAHHEEIAAQLEALGYVEGENYTNAFATLDNRHVLPLWESDAAFGALYDDVKKHTLLGKKRVYMLYQLARQALALPGDLAEAGVYRGGSSLLLCQLAKQRGKVVHMFDTFAGMPGTDASIDQHQAGEFADTSVEAVGALVAPTGSGQLHPGFFPDSACGLEATKYCFVHVDMDIYRSVSDCCAFFYPRLCEGGILLFDDYGFKSCPGVRQAVDEYFIGQKVIIYMPTGQAFVVK